ncbi:MAG: DNA mismatch repair endonuclease MutL [Planctomycetota bacterium]|nr:DNA mismatch repair endonuclease MutL [Planctomycetota bacterium]
MMRAPPEIVRLPELVAHQIAAGEVIERPAAVVKELIENSLDAGAARISVRVEDGGRRLIEVCDDGHGMRPGDLALALERHATSKIRSADDLQRVATLGFRGEALPSIVAVSEFEIASRPHDAAAGFALRRAGDRDLGGGPCAMAPGTRVTVRNLFWNVPARLKFLKQAASETGHIHEQVLRCALSHPKVAFALQADGREALSVPGMPDMATRIRALFGDEVADDLLAVAAQHGAMELTGFIVHPRRARPTARQQYVYCNGRYLRDRLLSAAIRAGCQGFLEPRLHAIVFLHLAIDPALVDVNVHPTKHEVRFRREGEIFALVSRALQDALASRQGGFPLLPPTAPGERAIVAERTVKAAAGLADPVVTRAREAAATYHALASAAAPSDPAPAAAADETAPLWPKDAAADLPPGVRAVWQVHDSYLVIETTQGLRIVDQHALHEKLLWLALAPGVGDLQRGGVQELVVPQRVPVSAEEAGVIDELREALAEQGIRVHRAGPTTLALDAYPAILARCDWPRFFSDLAQEGPRALARLSECIRHRAACHAAVKAGTPLSSEEQRRLVRALYELEGLAHCPHGRPTTLDLSWEELARRFQR